MGNNDTLAKIIENLSATVEPEKASFAIFHGHGSEESFIEATEDGLKLFALELLKAADKAGDTTNNPAETIIPFELTNSNWIDSRSQTVIQYIRPLGQKQPVVVTVNDKEPLLSKLVPFGCLGLAILLVAACLIGLFTIVKWIFQ